MLATSGFLLFSLEPMVGKMVLPGAGGTPGVWNACLFFFQACVLGGALYARALSRVPSPALQASLHAVVLAAALGFQPIAIDPAAIATEGGNPTFALLTELTIGVAIPVLSLCATTPLAISWLARSAPGAMEPYALYVASNAGSLAGLLAYPFFLEPRFGIGTQSLAWLAGHATLAAMVVVGAIAMRGSRAETRVDERAETRPSAADRIRWLALAAIPSSLTLGITAYLSADVAAGPLLWVIPLGLYLASWMPAFGGVGTPAWLARALMLFATPLVVAIVTEASTPAPIAIALHLAVFFLAALACHGRLAAERPSPRHAPEFHLWIALGGAVGGLANALVAPLVFADVAEYPLAILFACALAAPRATGGAATLGGDLLHAIAIVALALGSAAAASAVDLPPGRPQTLAVYLLPALIAYRAVARPRRLALGLAAILVAARFLPGAHGEVVAQARSFFGVVRVTRSDASLTMVHGRTVHGRQSLDPARRARPLAYYDPDGPLGSVFAARAARPARARVAAIGLGTGAAAVYARPEEEWTFYEIDPVVTRFAATHFTYLRDAPMRRPARIVMGDGRLRIAEARDGSFDLVILDAFGSDAIPTHLVTREALALYRRKLVPEGWLALHLSNRLLDFEPLVASLATEAGLAARLADDVTIPEGAAGRDPSRWAVLASDERTLGALADDPRWRAPRVNPTVSAWTDDFSSLWSLVRWRR